MYDGSGWDDENGDEELFGRVTTPEPVKRRAHGKTWSQAMVGEIGVALTTDRDQTGMQGGRGRARRGTSPGA